jgi:hypothetical protein
VYLIGTFKNKGEVMITIEQIKSRVNGNTVFAMNDECNADGTNVRWRVNGKVKFWKTRPNDFKIPVKHGMYDYGYITPENVCLFHFNGDWYSDGR